MRDSEKFPGYKVSTLGQVIGKRGRILKPYKYSTGYLAIDVRSRPNRKTITMGRLVAITFIPNPFNLETVNHKNGIKTDNRVVNLEWCSKGDNIRHAWATGLCHPLTPEEHGGSKIITQLSIYGEELKTFPSAREANRLTGIHYGNISKVLRGKSHTAGGFKWKYASR